MPLPSGQLTRHVFTEPGRVLFTFPPATAQINVTTGWLLLFFARHGQKSEDGDRSDAPDALPGFYVDFM